MITFHLHNLREFVRMTSYHDEFDYKPLPSSVPDEFIFSITDDNGVPVIADSLTRKLWRVNVGDVTAALLHKPQHGPFGNTAFPLIEAPSFYYNNSGDPGFYWRPGLY